MILNQLLINAVRYSPKRAIIKLQIFQDTQQATFKVQDQEIGIPETEQKIFNKFYRGSNLGNISDTGLGLSKIKPFVEAHRGSISVERALGAGTQFTILLPRGVN